MVVRMAFYSDVWLNVTPNGHLYTNQLVIYICIFFCSKVFLLISLQIVHFNGIFIKRLAFARRSSVFAFDRFLLLLPFYLVCFSFSFWPFYSTYLVQTKARQAGKKSHLQKTIFNYQQFSSTTI